LNEKSREVCSKARPPPASLALKGQVTEHTTVKRPIWQAKQVGRGGEPVDIPLMLPFHENRIWYHVVTG